MKKRILSVICVCVLLLSIAACTDQNYVENQQEEVLINEGEDTKTEVSYSAYGGEHSEMFLKEGDKIAVISPSALPSREQTDSTIEGLKKWGYEPVEGKHVCEEKRTLDDIVEDVNWALEDPEIKAIFCVRGGYGASEAAEKLSQDMIKASNKLIIGYSDITVYHSQWTTVGIPSIHACMSGTFNGLPDSCFEAEEKMLKGEMPTYTCEKGEQGIEGTARGVLVGGNLSTFTSVIGTAFDCTKTGQPYILFLEDVGEDVQHIHRYLTILKHTGVLDNASGIVFGEWTELPEDLGDYFGRTRGGKFESISDMITRQFLTDLDIPVAFGFPAGHGDINYPLLMGEEAELTVNADDFALRCGVN
ncbi:MAG: LD-carboxypeptidase [Butyrivibrio sp.]|nr:LD-carboxypeptidase [Butyrivibrio sp.]